MTNPVDFRARQVQVNKIIANDPDGPTNKILIYGNTANTDKHGGVNSGVFPQSASIALDTFLYVSGAVNSKTDSKAGIAVFGGDVVVSGAFYQGSVYVKGGAWAHAEGYSTVASGDWSHAEGDSSVAFGVFSHAEGYQTTASGNYSHAEGRETVAFGDYSHAEGYQTTASGSFSHAEGKNCYTFDHVGSPTQTGEGAHVEGEETSATGNYSHAEGYQTATSGAWSHAGGIGTMAYAQGQTVFGKYNINFNSTSTFVIGAGFNDSLREDLFAVEARAVNVAAHLVLSGGIRHHAIYTQNTANGGFLGAATDANLTKRNYIVISDTSLGDKTVELPRITDPVKDIGLTVVIKQFQLASYTLTIKINSNNPTYGYILGTYAITGTDIILNGDNTGNGGPDYTGRKTMSVTLTYMGDIFGTGYPKWVFMNVSDC